MLLLLLLFFVDVVFGGELVSSLAEKSREMICQLKEDISNMLTRILIPQCGNLNLICPQKLYNPLRILKILIRFNPGLCIPELLIFGDCTRSALCVT